MASVIGNKSLELRYGIDYVNANVYDNPNFITVNSSKPLNFLGGIRVGGNTVTSVDFEQTLMSGTEIGKITIDGQDTILYAPTGSGGDSLFSSGTGSLSIIKANSSSTASGSSAISIGYASSASGEGAFALGNTTEAMGPCSFVQGFSSGKYIDEEFVAYPIKVNGQSSFAITSRNGSTEAQSSGSYTVNGNNSGVLGGVNNHCLGDNSIIIGGSANTTSSSANTQAIIASTNCSLSGSTSNSVIIGCTNKTGTSSNTLYAKYIDAEAITIDTLNANDAITLCGKPYGTTFTGLPIVGMTAGYMSGSSWVDNDIVIGNNMKGTLRFQSPGNSCNITTAVSSTETYVNIDSNLRSVSVSANLSEGNNIGTISVNNNGTTTTTDLYAPAPNYEATSSEPGYIENRPFYRTPNGTTVTGLVQTNMTAYSTQYYYAVKTRGALSQLEEGEEYQIQDLNSESWPTFTSKTLGTQVTSNRSNIYGYTGIAIGNLNLLNSDLWNNGEPLAIMTTNDGQNVVIASKYSFEEYDMSRIDAQLFKIKYIYNKLSSKYIDFSGVTSLAKSMVGLTGISTVYTTSTVDQEPGTFIACDGTSSITILRSDDSDYEDKCLEYSGVLTGTTSITFTVDDGITDVKVQDGVDLTSLTSTDTYIYSLVYNESMTIAFVSLQKFV